MSEKIPHWNCIGGMLYAGNGATRVAPEIQEPQRPATNADDYDTWCENGSVCTRPKGKYQSETKGNGAWGDASGARGSVDIIIKSNLNGRGQRWKLHFIVDTGPGLTFTNPNMDLYQYDPLFDDLIQNVPSNVVFSVDPRGYNSTPILYTRQIGPGGEGLYYGSSNISFHPYGEPGNEIAAGTLATAGFNCPSGKGDCKFEGNNP